MDLPFLSTHCDSAALLFRQREGFLLRPEGDAAAQERLERSLRMHLHVLSRSADPGTAPGKAPQTFVHLAARLCAPEPKRRREGYEEACRLLIEGGGAGEGAFAALALYPDPEGNDRLLELYRSHETLRPALFRLWREQRREVPPGLLNRAELQDRDPRLQAAALRYAADTSSVGPEIFRTWADRLSGRLAVALPEGAMAAALRGLQLRGGAGIAPLLRRAIEREATPARRKPFLRLAALSGDPDLLPVLRAFCATAPGEGSRLLALHGGAEAVPHLLELLEISPEAASGWGLLAGVRLIRTGQSTPLERARAWWEEHRQGWPPGERRLFGRPSTVQNLTSLAARFTGEAGRDLLDLLALQFGRPLECSASGWIARRREVLRELSSEGSGGEARHA